METAEKETKPTSSETAENKDQTSHPWSNLSTVTAFDRRISTFRQSKDSPNDSQRSDSTLVYPRDICIRLLVQKLCELVSQEHKKNLYKVLCTELQRVNLIDKSNLIDFEILRKYEPIVSRLFSVACMAIGENPMNSRMINLESQLYNSRYNNEFREICYIAKGAFGVVYKALHRLDEIEYAIKKIRLKSKDTKIIDKYLKEVKTLAKLNHVNIVSYKAAWIELYPFTLSASSTDEFDSQFAGTKHNIKSDLNSDDSKDNDSKTDYTDSEKNDTIEQLLNENALQKDNRNSTDSSDVIFFRDSKSSKENLNKSGDIESEQTDCTDIQTFSKSHSQIYKDNKDSKYINVLFIQMSFCDQTLEEWLGERINQTPKEMIFMILQQILCGINYIHSQNIVHHDIKPSNIFISNTGRFIVQLGDFGLACTLQMETHSAIGTRMYAAPEQLQGKCDPKSDIYSIGIVLTELLVHTKTRMGLQDIIDSLKCGDISKITCTDRHQLAHMIIRMINIDPTKRPQSTELLKDLDIISAESKNMENVKTLTKTIREKDIEIQELQNEVMSLKEQVKKLLSTEDV